MNKKVLISSIAILLVLTVSVCLFVFLNGRKDGQTSTTTATTTTVVTEGPGGHTHIYTEHIVFPTCSEGGYTLFTCACGNSYTDNESEATGRHFYDKDGKCPDCNKTITFTKGLLITTYRYGEDADGRSLYECYVKVGNATDKDIYIPYEYAEGLYGTPYPVTTVDLRAFYGCENITSITIPSSVDSIGDEAFYGCTNLESITVPESVLKIGNDVFVGCDKLKKTENGIIYIENFAIGVTDTQASSAEIKNGTTAIYRVFEGCTNLSNITLPSTLHIIGNFSFRNCTSLKEITLPSGVTVIGDRAFYGCTGLTGISLSDGITSIEYGAFYNCEALEEITIPSSVEAIGDDAFYGCKGLTEVVIPEGVTTIGSNLFNGCTKLKKATIPKSVTKMGSTPFLNCSSLTDIYYTGTMAEFEAAGLHNNLYPPNSVIHCSDGDYVR